MSSIWHHHEQAGWQPTPAGEASFLPGVRFIGFGGGVDGGTALLVRDDVRARVNGRPVAGGFRVLAHQDEILLGRTRLYFSAESKPVVVPFRLEVGSRAPTCPVCRGPIRDADAAVRCPGCGRWYHQVEATEGTPGRPCWTYAATCRFCQHPTTLTGGPVWRPEEEQAHA